MAAELGTVAGWHAPVYQGLAQPLLLLGVPQGFLVADLCSTLLVALLLWWPALLVGLALYGLARVCTQVEGQWAGIAWAHLRHQTYYEG